MKDVINAMLQTVKETNAGETHVILKEYENDPLATAVVSMYYGQRPANRVLEDLYTWAEENDMTAITNKIEELEKLKPHENRTS